MRIQNQSHNRNLAIFFLKTDAKTAAMLIRPKSLEQERQTSKLVFSLHFNIISTTGWAKKFCHSSTNKKYEQIFLPYAAATTYISTFILLKSDSYKIKFENGTVVVCHLI